MADLPLEFEENNQKQSGFAIGRFLQRLMHNLHWILLCALVGFGAAKIYLRYQVPIYMVSSSIYVGTGVLNEDVNTILQNVGMLNDNATNNVNNQIFILSSYNLIEQVVDSLQLTTELTANGRIKQQPINLDEFPYKITARRKDYKKTGEYKLAIHKEEFTLINTATEETIKGKIGQALILPGKDTLLIDYNNSITEKNGFDELTLRFLTKTSVVGLYQSRLSITSAKQANEILLLNLQDEYPERGQHFLNTLLHYYDEANIQYKNQAIQKALLFLNNRIADLGNEINQIEESLKDSKVKNKLNDVSEAANRALNDLNAIDAQKGLLGYNEELLNLVENHIKSYNKRDEIVPSALSISDPVLAAMVTQYNQLLMQKRALKDIGTEKDPILTKINGQLEELRTNILKNIQNIRIQYKASGEYYSNQESKYLSKFNALPTIEKNIVQLERRLNIKQTVFSFLLQKKEEVGVQLASADVTNSRVVEVSRTSGKVSPQSSKIYAAGIILGLLLPIGILFVIQILNKRIDSKSEVESLTSIPIVGEINEVKDINPSHAFVIDNNSRSIIAEQYRSLRSNLYFCGLGLERKVILVTSFMRDEGKSFTSLNLADILSKTDKKVIILEFDLRRPRLSKKINLPNDIGLSNFLTDPAIKVSDLVKKISDENHNLHILCSGPIPPNPSELINSKRMKDLFDYLNSEFDFVIIDTAPVGLVADSFDIAKYADMTLYIVRHQFSYKGSLEFINQMSEQKRLPMVTLLINGIKSSSFDYGYGYGYGYSGTNGYGYSENETKSLELKKIFKKNKN